MREPRSSLPEHLARDLDAIGSPVDGIQFPQFLHKSEALEHVRQWCRSALARTHLVTVAAHLTERFNADLIALHALGVPVDLLKEFPEWRYGSRKGFRPSSSGLRQPAAGAAEPIGTLRLQLSPASGTV